MTTAATFGCASARDVSIETMRACAYGLRRIAPCTMPGRRMSSRYVPLPRMKRASSLRFRRPKPIGRSVLALGRFSTVAMLRPPVSRRLRTRRPSAPRRRCSCSRAAADRARDSRTDLVVGRIRVLVEQRARRHQHPRRAEAALQRVRLVEAHLHRIELTVDLERLDGADLVSLAHHGEDRAGLDRLAVHLHDARAAVGGVAAPVRAGQPGRVADEVDEQLTRLDVARDLLAVDRDRDVHVRPPFARAVARVSARVVRTPARCRL